MNIEAKRIIEKFGLKPHPEGGYFKENYRSAETISRAFLADRYSGSRNFSTSIYFLLEGQQVSHFHRLKSDEIWHFYRGSAINLHILDGAGYSLIKIGNKVEEGENPQFVIKAGLYFAAEVENKDSYSLIGCTVAPGFDFNDFELARRDDLEDKFPSYKNLIERFTTG